MTIRIFKLVTGEELISEYDDLAGSYTLKSPAVIVMQRTEQGVGVGLMPYMPYASGKITLNPQAVVSHCEADVKMINEYNRLFGSGIQIASAGSVPGL
jgi:hypothetical protein